MATIQPRSMSDKSPGEKYYWWVEAQDDENVEYSQKPPDAKYLRRLLARCDHEGFLSEFERADLPVGDFLQALGGEGLCLLMKDFENPRTDWANRYVELLFRRAITAPVEIVSRLAAILRSASLSEWIQQEEHRKNRQSFQPTNLKSGTREPGLAKEVILQVRRVVQITQMIFGDGRHSDTSGICTSLYRSPQERTFLHALSLRFPGLLALPNYPLDQIVALDRLTIDAKTLRYGRNCRLDAILIVPDEGDPVAVFELDSRLHDRPEVASRDAMKNSLIAATGLPFFRLRAESPESISIDEWYALLSDEVLPYLDLGARIRCRQVAYSLIPC